LYDKKRHTFFDIDGITKFRYTSPEEGIIRGRWGEYVQVDSKYAILAVSGNQVALLNLKTMKPVKARNGSAWFEAVVEAGSYNDSNYDYRGRIKLPFRFETGLLKLIYDSASGEQYLYNPVTDSFVNPYEGVPDGWFLNPRCGMLHRPGERYLMFVDSQEAANNMWAYENTTYQKIYKNTDDGSLFTVNGISVFTNVCVNGNVVAYMVKGSENVYYYDLSRNKPLEINGQPVITQYKADTLSSCGDYVGILTTKYVKDETGRVVYGTNIDNKTLLYNPYTGDFYHDDISGYFFKIYGQNHSSSLPNIKAYIPEDKIELVPDNDKVDFGRGDNYNKYYVPNAKVVASSIQTNESRMLSRIIRETLFEELRKLL
jgi:hypothetical protein